MSFLVVLPTLMIHGLTPLEEHGSGGGLSVILQSLSVDVVPVPVPLLMVVVVSLIVNTAIRPSISISIAVVISIPLPSFVLVISVIGPSVSLSSFVSVISVSVQQVVSVIISVCGPAGIGTSVSKSIIVPTVSIFVTGEEVTEIILITEE